MANSKFKCPKCGAELEDWFGIDPFIGEESEDRFRCAGHLIEPIPYPHASKQSAVNRTKSCGYLGLDDLDMECRDEIKSKAEN